MPWIVDQGIQARPLGVMDKWARYNIPRWFILDAVWVTICRLIEQIYINIYIYIYIYIYI